ncbi:MAG: hypothetical protein M0R32_02395 [Candidatus Cloacimonetes bacterium]|jgi:hypothetical protein|nr:hypothetical protein [Candidatus Cloacimonadota bacterium]
MEQNSQARIITCVYCGQAYPQDTPTWGNHVLTDHIKICEKHPLRKAEADIRKLRKALSEVIGADKKEELEKMKISMNILPMAEPPDIFINAIDAMLETMEYSE